MGCLVSKPKGSAEERARNEAIEKEMKQNKSQNQKKVKLLLLGAGESGKSTLLKQMQVIYKGGFKDDERNDFKANIYRNTISNMQAIITFMWDQGIAFQPENMERADYIADLEVSHVETALPDGIADVIASVWRDPGVQTAYARKSEFQLEDSAAYLFENVHRIAHPAYLPTDDDILRCRVKTSGIVETKFVIDKFPFEVYDVGGQKNERRKWIHCFTDVTAVIFTVALSEYDQVMREDSKQNRMLDSLELFSKVVNEWLPKPSIFLFLNKRDLFEEKLAKVPLTTCFPDYDGGSDLEAALKFIENKFRTTVKDTTSRQLIPRVTCATDGDQMRGILNGVKNIIIHQSLLLSGMV